MKNKRTKTEQANIDLNKALDGDDRKEGFNPEANEKYTRTEEANIKLNDSLNGENQEKPDVAPLINNNNISLVLNNNKKDD